MNSYSSGSCQLSAALEHLGLADIMQIVRLMSLCALGKMAVTPDTRVSRLLTTPSTRSNINLTALDTANANTIGMGGAGGSMASGAKATCRESAEHLQNLTKAIGALVQDNPQSLKQLVQLCTQVNTKQEEI